MIFRSAEEFLLQRSLATTPKPANLQLVQKHHHSRVELPAAIVVLANFGMKLFPVFQSSKFASSSLIKARMSEASSDLAELEELAPEDPTCWAIATGPDSNVLVAELAGGHGVASFHGLIERAIHNLQGDAYEWQTLSAQGGGSTFMFYRHPVGLSLRRCCKSPAPGLTLHGTGDYVLLPHNFVVSDADISVAPVPQLLQQIAFEEISADASLPSFLRKPAKRIGADFVPSDAKPGVGKRNFDVPRKDSLVRRSSAGTGGTFRVPRRC